MGKIFNRKFDRAIEELETHIEIYEIAENDVKSSFGMLTEEDLQDLMCLRASQDALRRLREAYEVMGLLPTKKKRHR